MPDLEILLEDGPLIAVNKPPGMISQGAPKDAWGLVDEVKQYLKQKYDKPGNVYLGVPHRLDRPVSGVMVFSRNSKCAARLSEQFANRQVEKTYWACVEVPPDPSEGRLVDWILRIENEPRVAIVDADTPAAKQAALTYKTLDVRNGRCLVEVSLETGRMHQIRVQLASRGWPIVGDVQYGATTLLAGRSSRERDGAIALHARCLRLLHPIRYDPIEIVAPVPGIWSELPIRCPTAQRET